MEKYFEKCVAEGALTEKENFRIYEDEGIYEEHSKNVTPNQEQPVAIILGGQNASGKSTLGKQYWEEYETKGGIAKVDGDELRDFHPKFKEYCQTDDKYMAAYTAKDSGRWTERLIDDLSRNKCNLIVETTLRNKEAVTGMVEIASNRGYDIQAKIFVVSYDKSMLGTYARYEKVKAERNGGRFVFEHALNAAYKGMPETLQALKEQNKCSCIHLYTREGTLFEGDYRKNDIVGMVQKERCREYTPKEINFLKDGWKKIEEMMQARGAKQEEYREIADRMANRIDNMINEGVAPKNISTMNEIYVNHWFPVTQKNEQEKITSKIKETEKNKTNVLETKKINTKNKGINFSM